MKPKAMYRLAVAVTTAAIFVTGTPLSAAEDVSAMTDNRVESLFKETYVYKTYLTDDAIKTDANDGVVTLTGTVAAESHRALAQETVANLPGVIRVNNQLVTNVVTKAEAEVAAENADTWLGRKVKLALLFRRNVDANKITIGVKDGIVTLTGEASSMAQKELTAEYAKDIEGVKDVKNEMTVATIPEKVERAAVEKIDDASITAQVKTALSIHHSTSSTKIKVETHKGEVTLIGIANNAAEKDLVTKLVTDIQGVTSVKNRMTVEAEL